MSGGGRFRLRGTAAMSGNILEVERELGVVADRNVGHVAASGADSVHAASASGKRGANERFK